MDYRVYRAADIEYKLRSLGVRPLDVMVAGVTGAGKSTTLNALFQKDVARVGQGVDPETMEITGYKLNDWFRIWDTPGLGDNVETDLQHKEKMTKLLRSTYRYGNGTYRVIDMALVIIEGANRDMGTTYDLLNNVIVPNIQKDRIFVVINQADLAQKGHHWNRITNTPDAVLAAFLEQQAVSVQQRVKESTGVTIRKPICYSAEYGWNLQAVFDFIVDNIPAKRRALR